METQRCTLCQDAECAQKGVLGEGATKAEAQPVSCRASLGMRKEEGEAEPGEAALVVQDGIGWQNWD